MGSYCTLRRICVYSKQFVYSVLDARPCGTLFSLSFLLSFLFSALDMAEILTDPGGCVVCRTMGKLISGFYFYFYSDRAVARAKDQGG